MFRLSRLCLFILPNSRSPEMPNFLLTTDATPIPHADLDDVLYKTVIEYDHQSPMAELFDESHRTIVFADSAFSGSVLAPGLTTVGVLLFLYTFGYNIGKPVVDAHRELWYAVEEEEEEDEIARGVIEDEEEA